MYLSECLRTTVYFLILYRTHVNYYIPLLASHDAFLQQYGNQEMAHRIVETDRQEVDFYKKYKDYYGYGFYVAQKFY